MDSEHYDINDALKAVSFLISRGEEVSIHKSLHNIPDKGLTCVYHLSW